MGKRGRGEWCRWHRFDAAGVKEHRCFPRDHVPENSEGYTDWTRGIGAPSDTALANIREAVRRASQGIPKTPEHREKMRQAKLGKPKSEQHRRNMSISHKRRFAIAQENSNANTEDNTQW